MVWHFFTSSFNRSSRGRLSVLLLLLLLLLVEEEALLDSVFVLVDDLVVVLAFGLGFRPSALALATASTNSLFSRKDLVDIPYDSNSCLISPMRMDEMSFNSSSVSEEEDDDVDVDAAISESGLLDGVTLARLGRARGVRADAYVGAAPVSFEPWRTTKAPHIVDRRADTMSAEQIPFRRDNKRSFMLVPFLILQDESGSGEMRLVDETISSRSSLSKKVRRVK